MLHSNITSWIIFGLRRSAIFLSALICACFATTFVAAQVPGSLDTTPFPGFASGNGVISAFPVGTGDDRANAVALQADGKIIVAGGCATGIGRSMCFARFEADGGLDVTFDGPNASPGNGKFTFIVNALSNEVKALVVQPDQKILALGTCDNEFCLARLNPDGSFDTSFVGPAGTGTGRFRLAIGSEENSAEAIALQADGKIVVSGSCKVVVATEKYNRFCAARLNSDGAFDASFVGPAGAVPGAGRFILPRIGTDSEGDESSRGVALQSDNKIVLGGRCPDLDAITSYTPCLVRLNPSGSFDTTFDGPSGAGNGRFLIRFGNLIGLESVQGIAVQPDGRILLASSCAALFSTTFCVARLTPNGLLDPEFWPDTGAGQGGRGWRSYSFEASPSDSAKAVALQPDGKILVAGTCRNRFCVLRANSDGSPDTAFDGSLATPADGLPKLSFGSGANRATSMVLQPDGKIILAGYCDNGTNDDFCIARVNGGSSSGRNCSLDIDGDGQVTATVDSLIHARIALGITGNAVIGGVTFTANATRNSWSEIRTFLVTQCGMAIAP